MRHAVKPTLIFHLCSEFRVFTENATSHLKLDPDWETILLIADGIRQNDVTYVFRTLFDLLHFTDLTSLFLFST